MIKESLNRQWRIKAFITCHLVSVLLIGTWLWPVTRHYWDSVDIFVFRLLNSSLEGQTNWKLFWALANHKYTDFVGASLMFSFCMIFACADNKKEFKERFAAFIMYLGRVEYSFFQRSSRWLYF